MKSESKRREVQPSKVRGSYVSQACAFCRRRKTRCDGKRPICTPCESSGHECTWSGESAKRPSTKQYVESLRNRIQALEVQVNHLEAKVARCRCRPNRDSEDRINSPSGSSDNRSSSAYILDDDIDDYSCCPSDHDEIGALCAPTEHLVLEDDDLQMYGPTSIFRLEPKYLEPSSRFPDVTTNTHDSYILFVDGDDKHYDSEIDWARHLPTEVPLTRREHDKVLDLLFKFFTSWCMRVVPALFLRDMYRALSSPPAQKTPHYSPMLHNALVALATAFSDDPRIRDIHARQYFVRRAKGYIESECQRPSISVVHALSVLASFHSAQGDQTLGYLYFGMSGRMSQALGLNVDCSPWVKAGLISRDDMLDRNWAHWTTFDNDVCWSLYVGRDLCVTAREDQRIPVPFVDSDFDQIPWHHPPSGVSPQPNFLSRTFAETCELLLIAKRIMTVVNRHQVNYTLISRIDVELNTWKEQLAPEVDITLSNRATALPHRIMLHLSYWWLFILLHRPFYRRTRSMSPGAGKDIDHIKLCNRAAENIMELLSTWRTLYTLRYAPITLVQVVFSAGTIFFLAAVNATSGARLAHVSLAHALTQAELCIQYLGETGRSWPCANHIASILSSLLQEQLKPRLAMRAVEPMFMDATGGLSEIVEGRKRSSSSAVPVEHQHPTIAIPPSGGAVNMFRSASGGHTSNLHHAEGPPKMESGLSESQHSVDPSLDMLHNGGGDSIFGSGASAMDFAFPLGMPGGETFPTQPFVPFGMTSMQQMEGVSAYHPQQQQQQQQQHLMAPEQQMQQPFLLTEEDLAALQQFLHQQQHP